MLPKKVTRSKETLEMERKLEEFLKKPRRPMTREERDEQRLSYVYGNMPVRYGLSKEDVAKILARRHGK